MSFKQLVSWIFVLNHLKWLFVSPSVPTVFAGRIETNESYYYVGETITLHCYAEKEFADVKFTYLNRTVVPTQYVTLINNTYARMEKVAQATDPDRTSYDCWLDFNKRIAVASQVIETEYRPQKVTNVTCVYYNKKDMFCTWDIGVQYKHDSDVKVIPEWSSNPDVPNNWRECSSSNRTACTINNYKNIFLSIHVNVTNRRRHDTAVLQHDINNVNHLIQTEPVRNLHTERVTSTCVSLSWKLLYSAMDFVVQYGVKGSQNYSQVITDSWGTSICNLRPNTLYTFIVKTQHRSKGYFSEPSVIDVQTKEDVETTTSAAEVTTSHGHHDITCTESRMEFSIPLSSPHASETATLSDPNCQINVTRTHVRGGVDLNSCGTTVQFQNDSVIFRNAIIFSAPESSSLGSSGSNSSVSQYQDIIPIQCVYNRIATVHLSYMPVVRRVLFTESGVGQFSFNIQQFWDASFTNMVSDRAYPLRMELDADVFIQLSVGSEGQPVAGHKEIGMEVQQCLVSPSSSVIEAQLHYYPLIQDGCPASSDVHIIPNTNASDSTVMRFRFRAVNFFDPSSSSSSSLVFVHCRMGLCLTGSCKPSAWSCLTPPARRVRRDVDQSKRAAHQLSTGPFLIMADEASTSSSSTTATVMAVVSTSVATVAIVIAAIALIALRRRRTTERN